MVPLGADNQANLENNKVRITNNREWSEEQNGGDKIIRICTQYSETVEHLVAGCTKLANSEHLTRHNPALMILAVA